MNLLAEKGLGQPLPEYLQSELTGGGFWFVGKSGSELGVEIPFAPGRLLLPPSTEEPLNVNPGFLGADACQSCHQDYYDTYVDRTMNVDAGDVQDAARQWLSLEDLVIVVAGDREAIEGPLRDLGIGPVVVLPPPGSNPGEGP